MKLIIFSSKSVHSFPKAYQTKPNLLMVDMHIVFFNTLTHFVTQNKTELKNT